MRAVCAEPTPTDAAEKGWGLRAERDLEVDEIVATIPRSMCLGLLASQRDHRTEYDADTAHEQGPWTGPPCIHALVDQVPEKFADIRCADAHSWYATSTRKRNTAALIILLLLLSVGCVRFVFTCLWRSSGACLVMFALSLFFLVG